MVGTRADDAHLDTVALIPAGKTIDDVDAVAGVEIVNGTFSVDAPNLERKWSARGGSSKHRQESGLFRAKR